MRRPRNSACRGDCNACGRRSCPRGSAHRLSGHTAAGRGAQATVPVARRSLAGANLHSVQRDAPAPGPGPARAGVAHGGGCADGDALRGRGAQRAGRAAVSAVRPVPGRRGQAFAGTAGRCPTGAAQSRWASTRRCSFVRCSMRYRRSTAAWPTCSPPPVHPLAPVRRLRCASRRSSCGTPVCPWSATTEDC